MPQLLYAFEESISNQGEWKHFSRIGVQGHKAVLSFQALPRTRDARDKRKSRPPHLATSFDLPRVSFENPLSSSHDPHVEHQKGEEILSVNL